MSEILLKEYPPAKEFLAVASDETGGIVVTKINTRIPPGVEGWHVQFELTEKQALALAEALQEAACGRFRAWKSL